MRLAVAADQAAALSRPRARRPRLAGLRRQLDDRVGAHRRHQMARQDHRRHGFHRGHAVRLPHRSQPALRLRSRRPASCTRCEDEVGTYNLATIMGGGEVVFELNTLIDHAGWKKAWEQYCRLHTAPQGRDRARQGHRHGRRGRASTRARDASPAISTRSTKNAAYAKKAWSGVRIPRMAVQRLDRPGGGDPDRRRARALHQQRRAGLPGSHRSAGDDRRRGPVNFPANLFAPGSSHVYLAI